MASHQDFIQQFASALNLEDSDLNGVTMNSKVADLAFWDSIALISMIIFANVHYSRQLTADQFKRCQTVQDIHDLVAG